LAGTAVSVCAPSGVTAFGCGDFISAAGSRGLRGQCAVAAAVWGLPEVVSWVMWEGGVARRGFSHRGAGRMGSTGLGQEGAGGVFWFIVWGNLALNQGSARECRRIVTRCCGTWAGDVGRCGIAYHGTVGHGAGHPWSAGV